ncbi:fungal-specific transcription factor domain-containing protein [Delphinella strobiligena]|nr:fungal-specific transcription factor domain-containing protein [Delphinella strobiligena]
MATRATSNVTKRSERAEDNLACKECRRRKANCDHKIPECSICRRYRRHCLYDKHSKTPLTRKHLTEVEHRLNRAEAILKRLFSEEQVTYILDQDVSGDVPVLPEIRPSVKSRRSTSDINESYRQQSWPESVNYQTKPLQELDQSEGLYPRAEYSDDEFEWDEQEQTSAGLGSGDFAAPSEGEEEGLKKIMDGMATLTVDAANYGYLGTASGASHLRTMWMETGSGPAWDAGSRNGRQHHMQQLLHQSQESSLTSSVHAQALVTRAMSDAFVDAYFSLYHPTFPALHEPTFRAQYANTMPRPSQGAWLVLANLVAATGAFVSSTSSDDTTDVAIFRTAKQYLSMNCLEVGNLAMVQVFGLISHYLQKRNRPNSSYSYAGLALRLAISLGLHKDLGSTKMNTLTREMRRRIWWSLCVLDVGATITYSRPLTWPNAGVDAGLPSNINEENITPGLTAQLSEVEEVTVCTYLREQSLYHLQTMPIYNRLISNPPPQAGELLSLDDSIICAWVKNVPHFFSDDSGINMDPKYALVHGINTWRYRNLRIICFRPFLVRWALQIESETLSWEEQTATDRCLQAAQETITYIQSFWNSRSQTRLTAFYVLYFLFQAALIPVHCLRSRPHSTLALGWRLQIEATLDILQSMTPINPSASKCRDVILSLCGSILRDSSTEMFGPPMQSMFEPNWDATTCINDDLWVGSLDNASMEFNFGS